MLHQRLDPRRIQIATAQLRSATPSAAAASSAATDWNDRRHDWPARDRSMFPPPDSSRRDSRTRRCYPSGRRDCWSGPDRCCAPRASCSSTAPAAPGSYHRPSTRDRYDRCRSSPAPCDRSKLPERSTARLMPALSSPGDVPNTRKLACLPASTWPDALLDQRRCFIHPMARDVIARQRFVASDCAIGPKGLQRGAQCRAQRSGRLRSMVRRLPSSASNTALSSQTIC